MNIMGYIGRRSVRLYFFISRIRSFFRRIYGRAELYFETRKIRKLIYDIENINKKCSFMYKHGLLLNAHAEIYPQKYLSELRKIFKDSDASKGIRLKLF